MFSLFIIFSRLFVVLVACYYCLQGVSTKRMLISCLRANDIFYALMRYFSRVYNPEAIPRNWTNGFRNLLGIFSIECFGYLPNLSKSTLSKSTLPKSYLLLCAKKTNTLCLKKTL